MVAEPSDPSPPDAVVGTVKLHIGGELRAPGWTNVNIQPGPTIDVVANCLDLSRFGDRTVSEIYASHVLEHLSHAEVPRALAEWHRVLMVGGCARISVPDLAKLGPTLIHPKLTPELREWIIGTIYGGQTDAHDFHKMGFTVETLTRYLANAGFKKVKRVEEFDLFDDSSKLRLGPTLISLNVVALKT